MTARQLYTAYQTLADAAGQSHLSPVKFARLYWLCQVDYLREMARQESTELVKAALRPFRRTWSTASGVIEWRLIDPPLMLTRSVRADFNSDYVGMPVTPVDSDELAVRQQDPFRRATNDDPIYIEEEFSSLKVLGETSPTRVEISYLTSPIPLDMAIDNVPLESVESQWDILRRVVAEKDLIDEKYNRYQLLANQVIPRAEQPI